MNFKKKNRLIERVISRTIGFTAFIIFFALVLWIFMKILYSLSVQEPPSEMFANFSERDGKPLNLTNWGADIVSFNDSKFNYRSFTYWSLQKYPKDSYNYVMKIDATLAKPTDIYRPYTGINMYLSYEPHNVYNLQKYKGIAFDLGVLKSDPGLSFFIQLADTITPERAWHVVEIPVWNYFLKENQKRLKNIFVPFSKFHYPFWYHTENKKPLDIKALYRVSFLLTGKNKELKGEFLVDNIRFIPKE